MVGGYILVESQQVIKVPGQILNENGTGSYGIDTKRKLQDHFHDID